MNKPHIEINNGRIFVEGRETVDPMLIGLAVLDFVEGCQGYPAFTFVLPDPAYTSNQAPIVNSSKP